MRYLSILFAALILLATSCMKDEEYTVSPNDILTFSIDTVAFDTIISGNATNTYTFTVYNRANKAIRIPKVMLQGGESSPFHVNVDGTPLTNGVAENLEIASRDSMIVFLMANVPETDSDDPIPVTDKLVFITESQRQQEVVLTASGQTVIPLTDYHVTENTLFQARRPYRIMDSLVVEEEATLILTAGSRLYFHPKAELIVKGSLRVEGELNNEVMIRGDRMGNMFDGQPYDRIPGQWGGIIFTPESYDNYINYADIHSGDYGVRVDSSDVERNKLVIENSVIHNTRQDALNIRMANVYVGNSQITNAGGNCVKVRGGNVSIVHCTIARLYVFTGGNGTALDFANYDGNVRLPINNLTIANTIVTGYQNDEIMGSQNKEYENDSFNYVFKNCLINTPLTDEENPRLVMCYWDLDDKTTAEGDTLVTREKNFVPEPNLRDLTFSFELSPHSKAIGHGDIEITAITYPLDRNGRNRGNSPDIGCYQRERSE